MCENRSCINRVQRFPGADASSGKLYLTVEIQAFEHSNTLPRLKSKSILSFLPGDRDKWLNSQLFVQRSQLPVPCSLKVLNMVLST